MKITADYHLHSSHSGDSDASMEDEIKKGIALGLQTMCFTEHNDFDYPVFPECPKDTFLLNVDSYLYDLATLKEKYQGQIKILFGVELGLQPQVEVIEKNIALINEWPFDFVIGSSHLCHQKDPYYPEFFEGRSDKESYLEYFESILENIKAFWGFDVYGHLNYVLRYGKTRDTEFSYAQFSDLLDEILRTLIQKGKGIELNTSALRDGLSEFHPGSEILKRYHELGGEIITIGSDSHNPANIAYEFDKAHDFLVECGFQYYTVFERRKFRFLPL